ncbi:phosphatase 2C family protein [Medicago truncatula]|uniref:Phosphatase 2C family protein n=1 Tax=Medicago truncatula TaxID=3880 RepID=G7KVD9_MEDTR|nr:phosphatase 2C family protein [Medicago truncatula]
MKPGKLYLANVGDSRAILVSHKGDGPFKRLHVKQMARDHNCENSDIREDLAILHPNDDSICTYDFGKWRVKGLTRCIGNAYMKKAEFTTTRFSQAPPGDGFWKLLMNEQAANIVNNNPRELQQHFVRVK